MTPIARQETAVSRAKAAPAPLGFEASEVAPMKCSAIVIASSPPPQRIVSRTRAWQARPSRVVLFINYTVIIRRGSARQGWNLFGTWPDDRAAFRRRHD